MKSKDSFYIKMATLVSQQGTCKRAKVGAVLVKDGCVIGTGYNGAARGESHCDHTGCDEELGHCVKCVHAETNAIINAAKSNTSTIGAIMFCTHRPCHRCLRHIINAGIVCICYKTYYTDERTTALISELKIEEFVHDKLSFLPI